MTVANTPEMDLVWPGYEPDAPMVETFLDFAHRLYACGLGDSHLYWTVISAQRVAGKAWTVEQRNIFLAEYGISHDPAIDRILENAVLFDGARYDVPAELTAEFGKDDRAQLAPFFTKLAIDLYAAGFSGTHILTSVLTAKRVADRTYSLSWRTQLLSELGIADDPVVNKVLVAASLLTHVNVTELKVALVDLNTGAIKGADEIGLTDVKVRTAELRTQFPDLSVMTIERHSNMRFVGDGEGVVLKTRDGEYSFVNAALPSLADLE